MDGENPAEGIAAAAEGVTEAAEQAATGTAEVSEAATETIRSRIESLLAEASALEGHEEWLANLTKSQPSPSSSETETSSPPSSETAAEPVQLAVPDLGVDDRPAGRHVLHHRIRY